MINDLSHTYLERLGQFLTENGVAIGTMATGVVIGETNVHHSLSDYLHDPVIVDLVKAYVGIFCTLGGFALMVYNTFFKKRRYNDESNSKIQDENS